MKDILSLIEKNDFEKAIKLIINKERELYNNVQYWETRGFLALVAGEMKIAIDCFEESIKLGSIDSNMYYNYGYACEQIGNSKAAVKNYALSISYGIADNIKEELINKYSENTPECNEFKKLLKKSKSKTVYCIFDLIDSSSTDKYFFENLIKSLPNVKHICSETNYNIKGLSSISFDYLKSHPYIKPVVIAMKERYTPKVRYLAEEGFNSCIIAAPKIKDFEILDIDSNVMDKVRNKEYLHTISVCRRHASDANIDAVLRYIPDNMKHYKFHFIPWDDRYSTYNMITAPLLSSVTLSGFGVFGSYPKQKNMINIELWHAGLGVKAIGLLDKKDSDPNYWGNVFKNIDIFCVPSKMNKVLYSSLFALPVSKYITTGASRNDLLLQPNAKERLEKLLNISLKNKKVIFNLPTFHVNSHNGRIEGSKKLQDNFKIDNFNYEGFDKFLENNNYICISKPHYAEEGIVSKKNISRKYKNTYFITNADLDDNNMNFYDVLAAGDLLITDYSSVTADFIFMNKPIVYAISDIKEYEESKGFTLQPFDFWNPGSKVFTQKELEEAIKSNLDNPSLFEEDRKRLLPVYYNTSDFGSSQKVWDVINNAFNKIYSTKSI